MRIQRHVDILIFPIRCQKSNRVICTNQVVLAERGNCPFLDKAMNIQRAGAVAAVLYNNV